MAPYVDQHGAPVQGVPVGQPVQGQPVQQGTPLYPQMHQQSPISPDSRPAQRAVHVTQQVQPAQPTVQQGTSLVFRFLV